MGQGYRRLIAAAWKTCKRPGCTKTLMEHHLGQGCGLFLANADPRPAKLCFNGWAGYHEEPVVVVGETEKRFRIRLPDWATSPLRIAGRDRWLAPGATVLVPKTAVKF